jgi:hypothetical protein
MPSAAPSPAVRPPALFARAAAALLLFSTWMGLLFAGLVFGGALHLLLVAAALLFPWRSLPRPIEPPAEGACEPAARQGPGQGPED